MKFLLLVITLVLFAAGANAQRLDTITAETTGVNGQYKFVSAKYIKRGVYYLTLEGYKYYLILPCYKSHTWKKKTKFSKYYTVTNTIYGVKISRL